MPTIINGNGITSNDLKLRSDNSNIATISFEEGASENRQILLPKEDGILATKEGLVDRSRKNYIINGNFDIWQRGTSQTSYYGYGSDDRWSNASVGSTITHSRQTFPLGQTDVPGNPKFFSRTVVNSVVGSTNFVSKLHRIESVRTLAGQKATLSFWAKADSNKNIAIEFAHNFGTGGSPDSAVYGINPQLIALTSTWQKKVVTVDIPSIAGKVLGTNANDCLWVNFWFDAGTFFDWRSANLGQQSGTFDIAQVQLEAGETATEFEYRTEGEELALCQRYYQDVDIYRSGLLAMDTTGYSSTVLRATMRTVPIVTLKTLTSNVNCTSVTVIQGTTNHFNHFPLGGTNGNITRYRIIVNLDAEL